jgi:hypothetical protein
MRCELTSTARFPHIAQIPEESNERQTNRMLYLSCGRSRCSNAFLKEPLTCITDSYYFQESIAQIFSFLPASIKKRSQSEPGCCSRTLFVFPAFTPPPATSRALEISQNQEIDSLVLVAPSLHLSGTHTLASRPVQESQTIS